MTRNEIVKLFLATVGATHLCFGCVRRASGPSESDAVDASSDSSTEPVIAIDGAVCTRVDTTECAVVWVCDYSTATYPVNNPDKLPAPASDCTLLGGPDTVGDVGWCCGSEATQ